MHIVAPTDIFGMANGPSPFSSCRFFARSMPSASIRNAGRQTALAPHRIHRGQTSRPRWTSVH